ncbi:MAG: PEP/pyruvate-binding domain-containing protein [Candidatus Hermodarchaeota archaeon]
MAPRQKGRQPQNRFQITFLHQLAPEQIETFGGKATNLARLHQLGFTIPNGFAIPTECFKNFVATCKHIEAFNALHQKKDDIEAIIQSAADFRTAASELEIPTEIANEIIAGFKQLVTQQGPSPIGYAVRSSATAEDTTKFSFAGQADSFLCVCDQTHVLDTVKRTWLSLYSPRALLYLQSKEINLNQVQMGVVVQEMILGQVSGVMFTTNVVSNNPDELIIDSSWGLGESVVAGKVNPDSFIIRKQPIEIIERRMGDKAVYSAPHPRDKPECTLLKETPPEKREMYSLDDEQLVKLTHLGIEIEQKIGYPQDIEWTYKDGEFIVLQTRPITTS